MLYTVEDDAEGINRGGGKSVCMENEIWGLVKALLKYSIRYIKYLIIDW